MTDSIYSTTHTTGRSNVMSTTQKSRSLPDTSYAQILPGQPETEFQDLFGELQQDIVPNMLKDFSNSTNGGNGSNNDTFGPLKGDITASKEDIAQTESKSSAELVPNELISVHQPDSQSKMTPGEFNPMDCHWPKNDQGPSSLFENIKSYGARAVDYLEKAWTRSIPDAQMVGLFHNVGLLGTWSAGVETVVNSETGQISFFGYQGPEVGWTATGIGAKGGYIYNLKDNADYAGRFFSANVDVPVLPVGVSVFATRDNNDSYIDVNSRENTIDSLKHTFSPTAILDELDIKNGSYGTSVSVGASVFQATGNYSVSDTTYSKPVFTIPYLGYFVNPMMTLLNKLDFD